MAVRNIISIDETRCNGCGECAAACAEGAIAIVEGKAKLVSQTYCDGLGACLGHCPMDAIKIEQREADAFDEEAVKEHLGKSQSPAAQRFTELRGGHGHDHHEHGGDHHHDHGHGGCPGMAHRKLRGNETGAAAGSDAQVPVKSALTHWPVQLKLVSPGAPFLRNADVLLVGDCVPFAMGDFHARFLKDHVLLVGCPKLDDGEHYVEKLAQIIAGNELRSLTVVHMEVPCCFGLRRIAEMAIKQSGIKLAIREVTISLKGEISA